MGRPDCSNVRGKRITYLAPTAGKASGSRFHDMLAFIVRILPTEQGEREFNAICAKWRKNGLALLTEPLKAHPTDASPEPGAFIVWVATRNPANDAERDLASADAAFASEVQERNVAFFLSIMAEWEVKQPKTHEEVRTCARNVYVPLLVSWQWAMDVRPPGMAGRPETAETGYWKRLPPPPKDAPRKRATPVAQVEFRGQFNGNGHAAPSRRLPGDDAEVHELAERLAREAEMPISAGVLAHVAGRIREYIRAHGVYPTLAQLLASA